MSNRKLFVLSLFFSLITMFTACGGGGSAGEAKDTNEQELTGNITVNSITDDNMISPTEAGETIIVSGTATGGYISVGDSVSFILNDTNYSTIVEEDGYWSVSVPGIDLASDTEFSVNVKSSDPSGNIVISTVTSTHTVDAAASFGTIVMSPITEDNVLNASEINTTIVVSGIALGKDITSGDVVSFVVNGNAYSTTVNQDGSWSVEVAGADLAVDTKFIVNIEIKNLTDKNNLLAGDLNNEDTQEPVALSTTSIHSVDTSAEAGVVTIEPITADDVINKTESTQSIRVSGTAIGGDISQGDSVSFTLNTKNYTTSVGADGSWSVAVSGADLAADTEFTVEVQSSDSAGNTITSSATSSHLVDTTAQSGSVSVSPITEDDIINANEATEAIIVQGAASGGDIKEGDAVTFRVNTVDYATTLKADGSWSINVAGADLAADKEFIVNIYSHDTAGNEAISSVTSTHEVDTTAQAGTLSINPITDDNVINKTEATQTITISGSASGGDIKSADSVSFVINGALYSTTLKADGTWSVDVAGADLAADTEFTVEVLSYDSSHNEAISSASQTYTVDTQANPGTVEVLPITADDMIVASELGDTIVVSGSASGGNIKSGDPLSFVLNGKNYSTVVGADGSWSVAVSGADLAADTKFVVEVQSSDASGNSVTSSTTSTHSVDTSAEAGVVTIEPITADDVINKTESTQSIRVSGTAIGGDISQGDSVSFTLNTKNYTTSVGADGSWSVAVSGADLAADTEFTVEVQSSDSAGNTITSSATSSHLVDTTAQSGSVSVSPITEDDIINANEATEAIIVQGAASGGDIKEGDAVTFRVNTVDYATTLKADGSWSINVAGADLAADKEFIVNIYSHDTAGNEAISSVTSTHEVDTTAQAGTLSINPITDDNVINKTEATQTITISGSASGGDIKSADSVSFVINGALYSTTLKADGTWSVDVAGADLAADTEFTVEVLSYDLAGNSVISSIRAVHTVNTVDDDKSTVRTKLATLNIDISSSGVYNGIVVNGSVINGLEYGCDNARYTTGQYGEFSCESLPITFFVGNLEIGSVTTLNEDKVVYVQDIFNLPRGGTRHPDVTKVSVLVQSLDEDADLSDGINITQSTIELLNTEFGSSVSIRNISLGDIETALQNIIQTKQQQTPSVSLELVALDDAQDNLTRVMAYPFKVSVTQASSALGGVNLLQSIDVNIEDGLESHSSLTLDSEDAFTLWTQGTSIDEMHPAMSVYLTRFATPTKTYQISFNATIKSGSPVISNIAFSNINSINHALVNGENIIKITPSEADISMIKLYFDGQTQWEFSCTDFRIVEL